MLTIDTLKAFLKDNQIRANYHPHPLFRYYIPWLLSGKYTLEVKNKTYNEKWTIHLTKYHEDGRLASDTVMFFDIQSGKKGKKLKDFLLSAQ